MEKGIRTPKKVRKTAAPLATLRMNLDTDEVEKIRTVKVSYGIKNTPELVRLLITEKYQKVTGTSVPGGKTRSKP